MSGFKRTPISETIQEAYGEHEIILHSSQIPIGIMNFCMRNCARVVGILNDGFILIESIVTGERFYRYIIPGTSWKSKTLGLHLPIYGKNSDSPHSNQNQT